MRAGGERNVRLESESSPPAHSNARRWRRGRTQRFVLGSKKKCASGTDDAARGVVARRGAFEGNDLPFSYPPDPEKDGVYVRGGEDGTALLSDAMV